ncbi:hypothetical protein GGR79_003759 [Xanthomonas arboricola]|nr:hypothetical protein [Xanthomonas arboricola]MBB4729778.1 hypothetical protein [Xanthomonas arboricola]MBB5862063.1 hypothetical protein [Xanthomonas arboricola]NJC32206.1 hypothetical protein [Xanthomonas arboricola]
MGQQLRHFRTPPGHACVRMDAGTMEDDSLGNAMKRTATWLLACTALGCVSDAAAQSLSRGWDTYRQQQKQQQAAAQSGAAQLATPAASSTAKTNDDALQSAAANGSYTAGPAEATTIASAPSTAVAPSPALAYRSATPREEEQRLKSGVFLGVQGGQGKVYEGIDQDMLGFNAGYRWRAGPVTLIGIEAAVGKLARISDHEDSYVPGVEFGSLGGTARFNFGDSPLFAVVRLGYWSANSNGESNERVSGAYAGAGFGVDIGRHASLSVFYTNYLYANDYYYSDEDITINRAEVLNVGAEVRF